MTDERANRVLSRVRQVTAQVDDDIYYKRGPDKMSKDFKIAVAGTGYVGLSIAR